MSRRVVSIDPGVNAIGWARFLDSKLEACGFYTFQSCNMRAAIRTSIDYPSILEDGIAFVIEKPQVYGGRASRGDTQDLLDLSIVAGRLAESAELVTGIAADLVFPRQWKGQRSKKVDHPLTVSCLSETERLHLKACKVRGSLLHNVIDATGIGLWHLGRRASP